MVTFGVRNGIPVPALASAVAYFDAYRATLRELKHRRNATTLRRIPIGAWTKRGRSTRSGRISRFCRIRRIVCDDGYHNQDNAF